MQSDSSPNVHIFSLLNKKMLLCTYLVPSSQEEEFIIRSAAPSNTE